MRYDTFSIVTRHTKRLRVTVFLWLLAGALFVLQGLCGGLYAQDAVGEKSEPSYQAVSTENPEILPDSLKLWLRPLSAEQTEVELAAWLDLLQAKAQELSQVELALLDPDKKEQVGENHKKVVRLDEEKGALIDRVRQVVNVVDVKGGDSKSAVLYVQSVGGFPTSGGASTVLKVMRHWLTSPQGGLKLAKSLGVFVLCLIVASVLSRILSRLFGKALQRSGRSSEMLHAFFVKLVRRVVWFAGLLIGISYLGVNIGPMLAAIGGAGFVIGFALKDSLGNFAAGLMILFYRPFDVGHFIKAAGVEGTVESLSMVATILKTPDNQQVIIPNGKIWNDVITNVSAKGTRRVDLVFGVGYEDDLQQAQGILEKLTAQHDLILEAPETVVQVHELADSSVNFVVRPWAKTSDYWDVYWDLTRQVKEAFDEAGISIPYPQRDVHVIKGEELRIEN
ncbi:MAG: mechanosensitive ion channel family protein [Verrucomicrobiales bacterium]|nr:mechanosensitive ion channel family protein [Verrucomicrobiales bacterium]